MDFVKEWKEKEVKSILEGAEEYKSKLQQLNEVENEAKDNLEAARREYFERTGEVASLERLTPVTKGYRDEELNKLYKIKEKHTTTIGIINIVMLFIEIMLGVMI